MKITQLTIYPIKSLRGISLESSTLTVHGLALDRRYILLQPHAAKPGKWENMFIGNIPSMSLFHCSFPAPPTSSPPEFFEITYRVPTPAVAPWTPEQETVLRVPVDPNVRELGLEMIEIEIHTSSSYPAWKMPEDVNAWFCACFGFEVILAFMGDGVGIRAPFYNFATTPGVELKGKDLKEEEKEEKRKQAMKEWLEKIERVIPGDVKVEEDINFSDTAALLVVSGVSVRSLIPRLLDPSSSDDIDLQSQHRDEDSQEQEKRERNETEKITTENITESTLLEKFRPNIVLDISSATEILEPWSEDLWSGLTISRTGTQILLVANCARCISINVDLEKGRMAEGTSGKLLGLMMRDRRVDGGSRWSPIVGRYGFGVAFGGKRTGEGDCVSGMENGKGNRMGEVRVGDEVVVSGWDQRTSVWNGIIPRLAQ